MKDSNEAQNRPGNRHPSRILIMMLLLASVFAAVAISASDSDQADAEVRSGDEGNIHWEFDTEASVLTLSLKDPAGSSVIRNYEKHKSPWSDHSAQSLVIKDGITVIGEFAFYDQDFRAVTIAESVKEIKNGGFEWCEFITGHLKLPAGLSKLGPYAFKNCKNITEVTIPISVDNAVDEDDRDAFQHDEKVKKITFLKGTGVGVNYSKDLRNNTLPYKCRDALTEVVFEEGITHIGERMFYENTKFTALTIPSTVKTIGKGAFEGCSGISGHLKLPAGLTSIGKFAFKNCKNITELTIPISVNMVVDDDDDNEVFYNCEKIAKMHFLKGTNGKGVDYNADEYNNLPTYNSRKVLNEVTFEEGIVYIGDRTLKQVTQLKYVDFPSTLTSIGRATFEESGLSGHLVLPEGITYLGRVAFKNCTNITEVTIPISVDNVLQDTKDLEVFYGVKNVKTIHYLKGTGSGYDYSNDKRVNTLPYTSRGALTTVTFEDGIVSLGNSVLYNAANVTSLVLPSSLQNISYCAFEGMTKLSRVTMPDSVKSIGNYAFKNCNNLSAICLSGSLESIGFENFNKQAFYDSDGSTKLKVNVENLRGYCFEGQSPVRLIREYLVTFDGNGGKAPFPNERSNMEGKLSDLSPATRAGYDFDGWFTEKSGGQKVDGNTLITANITIYAHWKEVKPTKVEIEPKVVNLYQGEKMQLKAKVNPQSAAANVWRSSDSSVVTVDQNGKITAVKAGNATITLTVQGVSGTCAVTVTPDRTHKITFDGNGGKSSVEFLYTDKDGYLPDLPEAARDHFTFDGWWTTPEGEGTKIHEEYIFESDTTVYARWNPIPIESVTVKPATVTLVKGGTANFTVTIMPENAYVETIEWESDSENVTIVPLPDGRIATATVVESFAGAVNITVTVNGEKSQAAFIYSFNPGLGGRVTFDGNGGTPELQTMKTNPKTLTLDTMPVIPENGRMRFAGWFTQAEGGELVVVDEHTIFPPADKTVYAHWEVIPVEEVRLFDYKVNALLGATDRELQQYVLPQNATYPDITAWVSSDTDVVTVDEYGKITFVGLGTAQIIAWAGNIASEPCTVIVSNPENVEVKTGVESGKTVISNVDDVIQSIEAIYQRGENTPVLDVSFGTDALVLNQEVLRAIVDYSAVIDLDNAAGYIYIDNESVKSLTQDDSDVTFAASVLDTGVSDSKTVRMVEYTFNTDKKSIDSFGGYIEVAIRYSVSPGQINDYSIYYFPPTGEPEQMAISGFDKNFVSFYTNHFSAYGIVYNSPDPPVPPGPEPSDSKDNLGLIVSIIVVSIALLAMVYFIAIRKP